MGIFNINGSNITIPLKNINAHKIIALANITSLNTLGDKIPIEFVEVVGSLPNTAGTKALIFSNIYGDTITINVTTT